MTTNWNPTPSSDAEDGRVTLGEAVGQALGTASMCWETVSAAGVFDSTACGEVYDGLMAHLDDWAHEQRKQANEATAAKLAINIIDPIRIALERIAQAAEQYLDTEHRDEARDLELRRNLGEAVVEASLALYPAEVDQ